MHQCHAGLRKGFVRLHHPYNPNNLYMGRGSDEDGEILDMIQMWADSDISDAELGAKVREVL